MAPLSKSQVNKLGDRLRGEGLIQPVTLELLQELRARYIVPMARVQALLRDSLGLDATSRLKTVNTIVEKLRREKTRLAEMQDIAGLRVVHEMTLGQQDDIVQKIGALLHESRVVDRRQDPRHGYRAVHVIAQVDACSIEIQVRSRFQDLWAQAMERLADREGRAIRYGVIPIERTEDVNRLLALSAEVAEIEAMMDVIGRERSAFPPARRAATGQREIQLINARFRALERQVREQAESIRATLAGMQDGRKEST